MKRVEIVIDYLCGKMKLPKEVGDRAFHMFYRLRLGRKVDLPFPVLVDFVLRSVQLSARAHEWKTRKGNPLDTEVVELASVLAERIHEYETPRQ
jgi:hypothetical protein